MKAPEPFSFIVFNDMHVLCAECDPWLRGLMGRFNDVPGAELALMLGDLAEDGTREQLEEAKGLLGMLKMPVYMVPGNHDGPPGRAVGSGGGGGGGAGGLAEYERLFPGRRNYTFAYKGWQFVGLDTTNGSGYMELPVPEETLAFAREAGEKLDALAPTILFTHMPLAPEVKFSSSGGRALLEALSRLNVRIVFSGHFHGRTMHRSPLNPMVQMVTNTCVSHCREIHDGTTQRGYYVCRAEENLSVTYKFVEYRGVK